MDVGDKVRLSAHPAWVGEVRGFAKIYWSQDVESPGTDDVLVEWESGGAFYYPPEHLVVLDQSD